MNCKRIRVRFVNAQPFRLPYLYKCYIIIRVSYNHTYLNQVHFEVKQDIQPQFIGWYGFEAKGNVTFWLHYKLIAGRPGFVWVNYRHTFRRGA